MAKDISNEIVSQLPFLRRYARALLGAQDSGDEYVRVALESYLHEPARIQPDGDVRLQLFALFHAVWSLIGVETERVDEVQAGLETAGASEEPGVGALPPLRRQVLLLVSLEGFSFDEVAYILKADEAAVRETLDEARRELAQQANVDVLVIEDEPLIAQDIADLVEEMGHRVIGTAAREAEAVKLAQVHRPALVLADIQLKGSDSGIQAVEAILRSMEVPVIFVTGFPERLLTGERLEPAFLITKPFVADTVERFVHGHNVPEE